MSLKNAIYLDYNAGAPLHPLAVETLRLFFTHPGGVPGNPSSIHAHGQAAKRLLAESRESLAHALGAKTDPERLIFTSCGSESNQLAIRSILSPKLLSGAHPHWITTPVEHDSVLQMRHWVESRGGSVSILPVDLDGRPLLAALRGLWRSETALVSLIWVNNETGVLTPVELFAQEVRSLGGVLHVDAAQAFGKVPFDVGHLGAQLVSLSGHKIGALSGIGALWVERGVRLAGTVLGKQEKGRRGGTESLSGIASFGAAARGIHVPAFCAQVAPLRDRLQSVIEARIPGVKVNGIGAPRVVNTLNLSFEGVQGDSLVMALDLAGYSVSAGSACSSGVLEPFHVLLALGRTRQEAMAAIRVSIGSQTRWEDLEGFVEALEGVVRRARESRRYEQRP